MTVLKQLLKEFWLPLLAALFWTIYNFTEMAGEKWSIRAAVNMFAPTFFLASWLVSQWYRVRKQQRVESGLSSIEGRVQQLLTGLDEKTADLAGYVTGGESVCCMMCAPGASDTINSFAVENVGKHPLYEVYARVIDLETFEEISKAGPPFDYGKSEIHFDLGSLIPGLAKIVGVNLSMRSSSSRNFNIFYTARNGSFTQEFRYRRVNGNWLYATQVSRQNGIVHEQIQQGFPRNANGAIDW